MLFTHLSAIIGPWYIGGMPFYVRSAEGPTLFPIPSGTSSADRWHFYGNCIHAGNGMVLQVPSCFSSIGTPEMPHLLYSPMPHRTTEQANSNDKCAAAMFAGNRKTSQDNFALSSLVDPQLLTLLHSWSAKVLGGVC